MSLQQRSERRLSCAGVALTRGALCAEQTLQGGALVSVRAELCSSAALCPPRSVLHVKLAVLRKPSVSRAVPAHSIELG